MTNEEREQIIEETLVWCHECDQCYYESGDGDWRCNNGMGVVDHRSDFCSQGYKRPQITWLQVFDVLKELYDKDQKLLDEPVAVRWYERSGLHYDGTATEICVDWMFRPISKDNPLTIRAKRWEG